MQVLWFSRLPLNILLPKASCLTSQIVVQQYIWLNKVQSLQYGRRDSRLCSHRLRNQQLALLLQSVYDLRIV